MSFPTSTNTLLEVSHKLSHLLIQSPLHLLIHSPSDAYFANSTSTPLYGCLFVLTVAFSCSFLKVRVFTNNCSVDFALKQLEWDPNTIVRLQVCSVHRFSRAYFAVMGYCRTRTIWNYDSRVL